MDAPGKTDEDKQQIQFADKDDKKIVDHLIIKELQDCIREETAKLPAIYSEVIILKELENYSYEEIAKILDIPLDTVGVRLIRGRKILKENLKNYI